MLLLPPSSCPAAEFDVDLQQYAVYVGATTNPVARLQSHARPSTMLKGVKAALQKRQQSAGDLFWLPLCTAPPGADTHNAETLWTLRAQQSSCYMLNFFGIAGTPARTRVFFPRQYRSTCTLPPTP